MKVTFFGGVGMVTGSKTLVEICIDYAKRAASRGTGRYSSTAQWRSMPPMFFACIRMITGYRQRNAGALARLPTT